MTSYIQQTAKRSFSKVEPILDPPTNLIQVQLDSYRWFQEQGLAELLKEFSCIPDLTGTQLELRFFDYEFRHPRHTEEQCHEHDLTYSAPLYAKTQLIIKKTGEIKEQLIFLGDFPLMTCNGTFIVSGTERVVVSQLIRSPGVHFTKDRDLTSGRDMCSAKLIPTHGAWLDFETSTKDAISVKVEGKRRIPITTLLRAIGYEGDQQQKRLFEDVDISPEHHYILSTMERETSFAGEAEDSHRDIDKEEALKDIYRRLRPGDPVDVGSASSLINNLLFNSRRYNLGRVGRYKLNKRVGKDLLVLRDILTKEELKSCSPKHIDELSAKHLTDRGLTREDIVAIVRHMIMINNGIDTPDDIDHLGNRRVRTMGELLQNQLRLGFLRLERIIKERMSVVTHETATPSTLVNIRPIIAAIREFFAGSQLSQFMDQTNPLAELTHKRRLSALGPGGLSRERAGFEVRDVHYSHYGRICPIETPEGPNIGLIGALSTYSTINEYGFIETPYRKVIGELQNDDPSLINQILLDTIKDDNGKVIARAGAHVTPQIAKRLSELPLKPIGIMPFVSETVTYYSADEEEPYIIAQSNTPLDDHNHFITERIEARAAKKFLKVTPPEVDLMDVSPKQIVSVTTSLIPFLEHDDANRALMGSNMQRQAVPLLRAEPTLVGTGMERLVARDSGHVISASEDGIVTSVTADHITLAKDSREEQVYQLRKFSRTNQGTCLNQRVAVNKGDRVKKGQVLADGTATKNGELALGQNVLCAFMSWKGYNFEDAVILSERLVEQDKFTSIHIERYEVESQDTKLGPEEITRDVPGVGEESLRDLDEDGIISIGAEVESGDILVGKITPKGETELTAEEKLLRALFGEKARKVKDSSLRMPHGERGRVITVRVFSREKRDELPAGVNKLVRVWVAQKRKVSEGDKLTGRHGNKGVIARILPPEDMPFLENGTPVDIILNPVGVPSRMNLGQILETHLGWAADSLGFRAETPIFEGANNIDVEDSLSKAWLVQKTRANDTSGTNDDSALSVRSQVIEGYLKSRGYPDVKLDGTEPAGEARHICLRLWLEDHGHSSEQMDDGEVELLAQQVSKKTGHPLPTSGKMTLYDGCTGEPFDMPVTVGFIYMMKLIHLVEDKIHARSTGPYSLVTQQPLGGKAQFGGQRFGEMEAWALEAYGAAYTLQELLTIKSDDVIGRAKAYESIIKGEDTFVPRIPGSFRVLVKELQSLGLSVKVTNEKAASDEEDEVIQEPKAGLEELEKGEDNVKG